MARHNTQYTLYKTGRTDPTYQNTWAFANRAERDVWLNSKNPYPVLNCQYWRPGEPIKIKIPYNQALYYDYVMINNDGQIWYAFVTGHEYVSPSVTRLTLAIDYIQTYYFTKEVDGETPWWNTSGFIARGTAPILPPRGTPSEYPVPESTCMRFDYAQIGYGVVIYSSVDLTDLSSVTYTSAIIDGQYTASPPYVMQMDILKLNELITTLNTAGLTDAISGIYLFPLDYVNVTLLTNSPQIAASSDLYKTVDTVIQRPTSCGGYTPRNNVLLGYDYSYITINNGVGEIATYHFEDFSGNPSFSSRLSLASGSPVIILYPNNYIAGDGQVARQMAQKIPIAPACTYLNDSFRIWLAQTQNSRAAAVNGAQVAISQANEAREKSFAAQYSGLYESAAGAISETVGDIGKLISRAESVIPNPMNTVPSALKTTYNAIAKPLNLPQIGQSQSILPDSTEGRLNLMTDIGLAYVRRELGIETAYQYDHAVQNAQLAYDKLLAGYTDKSRVPATAAGSNAYGDMCVLRQYGFMISVFTPTYEYAQLIDDGLSASGHNINTYGTTVRTHKWFDFVSVKCAYIPINIDNRPEYIRKMMQALLANGVYLWHIYNGDISPQFGAPYKLDNPEVIA